MIKKALPLCAWGLLVAGGPGVAFAQQVNLTLRDGRVTLRAENATARQILDEWARIGQARVVNADKVTGPPMTLTLVDVPESQALETVLRSAAGYAVTERATMVANASTFDRIILMARTTPVSQTASAPPAASQQAYQPVASEPEEATVMDENEPPQPSAPVINPYGNAGDANAAGGANGAAGANGTVNVRPPETRFDYANPQQYFEQQRQQQNQLRGQQGQPPVNPYPGSNYNPYQPGNVPQAQPQGPTSSPTAPQTTNQPGMAPMPQAPPQTPPGGAGFNPYNMNPYNMPPTNPSGQPGPNVQPDRAKYSNPYQTSKPQPEQD